MSKIKGISQFHGKELKIVYEKDEFIVFPMYHPAAIMYNGSLRPYFEKDFKKLGSLLNNGKMNAQEQLNKFI
jgi:DNA polymerase